MRVRPARRADVPAILAIEDESFATDKLTAGKLRHLLARGNCALLLAVERTRVLGYALVLFRRGTATARLYGIAVRGAHRGRGLGRRLLRAAEAAARTGGARSMRLEVGAKNVSAVALYRETGYALVSHLGPYYEDGSPADRYIKNLTKSRRSATS